METSNHTIAATFLEIAELLEIDEANPFRIRAYRNAARTIDALPHKLSKMVAEGEDLTELPGIGEKLAQKIEEIVKTGGLKAFESLKQRIPPELEALLEIPGLGPKRVHDLFTKLRIRSLSDLQKALEAGKVQALEGFGPKLIESIAAGIQQKRLAPKRYRLAVAEAVAGEVLDALKTAKGVKAIEVAGSIRRRKETVKDIDIVCAASMDSDIMDVFVSMGGIKRIVMQGPTRSSVELSEGLHVDLRVVQPEAFGSALHHFTGSKAHNIALRKIAENRGLKINEYGIYKGVKRLGGKEEKDIYDVLKMDYIVPELREDRGEVDRAHRHVLPELITQKAIRGDLHVHTTWSDGKDTLEAMALAAEALGYEYIALTDHTKHLTVAHGQDEKRLLEAMDAIDAFNAAGHGITVLKSAEVDILEDGSLDLEASVLERLDLVVGAVHSKFNLSKKAQTKRIITAMEHPVFSILAHPSGRLLGLREPYEVDLPSVIAAAKALNVILELNAQPDRLDLDDLHCKAAKEAGVKIAVSTDAHSTGDLQLMRYGIGQARRGWLERGDVVNTLSLKRLKKILRR
jgi:DNA polymerase (family 10)